LFEIPPEADVSGIRSGSGCEKCRKTGYRGRTGVFELLEVTDRIRAMIRDRADESEITKAARVAGMEPLLRGAVRKLLAGQTTAEEIVRVVPLIE